MLKPRWLIRLYKPATRLRCAPRLSFLAGFSSPFSEKLPKSTAGRQLIDVALSPDEAAYGLRQIRCRASIAEEIPLLGDIEGFPSVLAALQLLDLLPMSGGRIRAQRGTAARQRSETRSMRSSASSSRFRAPTSEKRK